MNRENLGLAAAISVPMLVLLTAVGFEFYAPTIAKIAKDGVSEQWLGFIGNLIGAAVTLTAAFIAWFAVQRQIHHMRVAKDELHTDARSAAEFILMPVMYSAAMLRSALVSVQQFNKKMKAGGRPAAESIERHSQKFANVLGECSELREKLEHYTVQQGWQGLADRHKQAYLAIISYLTAAAQTLSRVNQADLTQSMQMVDLHVHYLRGMAMIVRDLSHTLADSFEEMSGDADNSH